MRNPKDSMSVEQLGYYDLIQKVETLSYPLSEDILMNIYGVHSPDKAERVLYSLKKMGIITYDTKDSLIQYGGRLLKTVSDVKRNCLEAMHIAMACIKENGDGKDALESIYVKRDGTGIYFSSNDVTYNTIHINPQTEWPKIKMEEMKYKDSKNDDLMTMFIFSSGFKTESIVKKLRKENLTLPFIAVVLKSNDIIHCPKFELVTDIYDIERYPA